jgi:hypothetical protein
MKEMIGYTAKRASHKIMNTNVEPRFIAKIFD